MRLPRRTLALTAAAAVLTLAGITGPTPPTATAAPPPPVTTGYTYTPLNASLAAAIRSAPCAGGRVDLVVHNTGDWRLTSAVIDRANCGTRVRLITWYHKQGTKRNGPLQLAQKQMRDAIRAHGGTFVACSGACLRDNKGDTKIEHEKLAAIDNGRQLLVLSDSGNWTLSNDAHPNDRMTVDDRCLYAGTLAHIDQLQQDRAPRKPIRSSASCDGTRRLWWMPVAKADPTLDWARKARCGRGSRVVWSSSIVAQSKGARYGSGAKLVAELVRLRKAGARVDVTTNREHWSTALEKRLRAAGVTIHREGSADGYRHLKTLGAVGCAGGPFMSQGSATTASSAYDQNGNQVLTSTRAADAAAVVAGFDRMF